jgi:hypothetical protein
VLLQQGCDKCGSCCCWSLNELTSTGSQPTYDLHFLGVGQKQEQCYEVVDPAIVVK